MYSAFGVDHGYEIEKGIFSAIGGGLGQKAVGAASGLRRSGAAGLRQGAQKQGLGANVNAAKSAFAAKPASGIKAFGNAAKVKTGAALGRVGGLAQRNPAAAGGIATGTAGVGVAGAGFGAGRMGNDDKKLSQYR